MKQPDPSPEPIPLHHEDWGVDIRLYTGDIPLSREESTYELAVDIYAFGAAAVASEIQASHDTGTPTVAQLPGVSLGDVRHQRGYRIGRLLSEAGAALDERAPQLQSLRLSSPEVAAGPIEAIMDSAAAVIEPDDGSGALVLAAAGLPPILRSQADSYAAEVNDSERTLKAWLHSAAPEQVRNFTEWYGSRLSILSDPKRRESFDNDLKSAFIDMVGRAVGDGWIDARLLPRIESTVRETEIRYFSPFSDMASAVSGLADVENNRPVLYLPTVAGNYVSTHEFGHVAAGTMMDSLDTEMRRTQGDAWVEVNTYGMHELVKLLNEGFADHLAHSLAAGEPAVMHAAERTDRDQAAFGVASRHYAGYRDALAIAVEGVSGPVGMSDIRLLTTSILTEDAGQLSAYIDKQWHSHDVLAKLAAALERCYEERIYAGEYSHLLPDDVAQVVRNVRKSLKR